MPADNAEVHIALELDPAAGGSRRAAGGEPEYGLLMMGVPFAQGAVPAGSGYVLTGGDSAYPLWLALNSE